MKPNFPVQQLQSIQGLRGFAAWLVVWHHFTQIVFTDSLTGLNSLIRTYGSVGVDIFFVVSGFVISVSAFGKKSTKTFYLHRLSRLVPAYWLVTLLAASLYLVEPRTAFQPYVVEWPHLLKSLFFIPASHPSGMGPFPVLTVGWSVNFEILFYLLFGLLLFLPDIKRFIVTSLALVLICHVLSPLGWVHPFYDQSIFYEFVFGMALALLWQRGFIQQNWHVGLLFLALVPLSFYFFTKMGLTRGLSWGVPSALLVCASLMVEGLFRRLTILNSVGNMSYSTYLIHGPVITLGLYCSIAFNLNHSVVAGLCVPLILFLSWLNYEYLELRLTRFLRLKIDTQHVRASNSSRAQIAT